MFDIINGHMPIPLQMALARDEAVFNRFLNMSDSEQDEIIQRAEKSSSLMETEEIVKEFLKST
jgi:hypothetical protein